MVKTKKELTSKEKWTAEEAGRIVLKINAEAYAQKASGCSDIKIPYTQKEIDKMINSLTSARDREIYRRYEMLVEWITEYVAASSAYFYATLYILERMQTFLSGIRYVEDFLSIQYKLENQNIQSKNIIPSDLEELDQFIGLGGFLAEQKDSVISKIFEGGYKHLTTHFFDLIRYNSVIKLLSVCLEIEELECYIRDVDSIFITNKLVFEYIEIIKDTIKDTYPKTSKEYKEKIEALDTLFPPINLEEYEIPKEELEALSIEITPKLEIFSGVKKREILDELHPVLKGG